MAHIGRKAFTLIELLVVVSIIGLLSGVAMVSMNSSRDKAKLAASQDFEAAAQRAAGSEIIGEWLMNEGSGNAVGDSSGNGYNGTRTGATWTAGVEGSALAFVPGNYVSLGNAASLNPSNFTITAWVKPGDFSGGYNYIYSNSRDCCGTYNGINFYIYTNNLSGRIWNGGAATVTSNAKIPNGSGWTFVAFSYNGSKMSLYINGHLDNSAASALGIGQPASFGTYIGALGSGYAVYGINGTVDQVRLYGSAIVASEIERIYLAERGKYLALK